MALTGNHIRSRVEKYLTDSIDWRDIAERCRDYKDGKQWTELEAETLKRRHQAPIVVNRVKPKVEGLIGLYDLRKTDPKAYPRTIKHEEAGHIVTDALRFVADNTGFESTRLDAADDFFVEGVAGAIVDTHRKGNEEWIRVKRIPWDRIYYDPHSRELDFSDSTYFGVILWMYMDQAKDKYKKFKDWDNLADTQTAIDETYEDRPRWIDKDANRVRVAMHFEKDGGEWKVAVIVGETFIIKPMTSPFQDDDGDPTCPIELVSAYIDRDNMRYGEVYHYLDIQDEINHRRSKALHNLNSRQTFGRKGEAGDVGKMKRELKKPDGHVEFEGDVFGKDFGILPPQGDTQGHFEFYQDAKGEMDATSFTAELAGDTPRGDLSGKAIAKLQQAGTIEVNRLYSRLNNWEYRIYKQIWGRIKQTWNAEKWIRVVDDQDALRWVGFNTPITVQELLEEKINDESISVVDRRLAAMTYTQMIEAQDPRLQELAEVRNPIPELEVDLIIDQSFDVINAQEEQFNALVQLGGSGGIDIIELLTVSNIRGKDELIEKIEKRRQEQAQAAGSAAQLETQERSAKIENTQVNTANTLEEAKQKAIESEIMLRNPDPNPQAIT